MAPDVEIQKVQLGAPGPDGESNPEDGTQSLWLDAAITITNHSATVGYYIVASLRRLTFDQRTATLHLWLREPVGAPDHAPIPFRSLPKFQRVAPGKSKVLTIRIPALLNHIAGDPAHPVVETADLTAARTVDCRIAFSDAPYRARNGPADGRRQHLVRWGQNSQKRIALPGPGEVMKKGKGANRG